MSKLKTQVKYILDQRIKGSLTTEFYFISERDIKPGDLCFNSYDNRIWEYQPIPCPIPYWGNLNTLKKLEATTNKALNELGIPLIPESFVYRCKQKDYKIEFVNLQITTDDGELSDEDINNLSLAIRKDGTVIVTKVKEVFSSEEVREIALRAYNLGRVERQESINTGKYFDSFNEWIDKEI